MQHTFTHVARGMGRPGQTRHDSGRWSGLENPQHLQLVPRGNVRVLFYIFLLPLFSQTFSDPAPVFGPVMRRLALLLLLAWGLRLCRMLLPWYLSLVLMNTVASTTQESSDIIVQSREGASRPQ